MESLVVYSLVGAPVSYIGEVVANTNEQLVLRRVLVLIQAQARKGESKETIHIGNVPFASRDSTVTIMKQTSPGVLIENIDTDLQDHYKKEVISAYSKLSVIS